MSFEESVMSACASIVRKAATPAFNVSDGEVKTAAERIARTGYDFRRTPNALKALRAYLNGKPLFLGGTAGAGKTKFFTSLRDSGVARNRIFIYPLSAHGNDFCSAIVDDMRDHLDDEVVVDDVGCESTWNGNRADDVLSRIIAVRESSERRTHFTSNLDANTIKGRYDERVISRLRLCVFVPMVGADNRKPDENAAEAEFRAKCADPESWRLCADMCAHFKDGKCARGIGIPPSINDRSPYACPVFEKSAAWIESEIALKRTRREGYLKLGMQVPESLQEVTP